MKRRLFLIGLASGATLVAVAGPAMAASFAEDLVDQLTKQGFSNITLETTWLGRVRILASRDGGEREIILNPRTGEILRDTWTTSGSGGASKPILDDVADGSGGGDDHGGDTSGSGGDSGGGDSGGGDSGGGDSGGGDSGGGDSGGGDSGGGDSGKDDGGSDDKSGKGN